MKKFNELGLSEDFLKNLEKFKFSEATEIQEKAIPLVLKGKDILGESATGSGKTLAFGAGIIEKVEKEKGIQALIMTPTRELAEQVTRSLVDFSSYKNLNIASVYGGVSIEPQIKKLKDAEIVVGTPGRILDHIGQNTINLKKIDFLVLDEADRMLDMGFIKDVKKIISQCKNERQTLLFSATLSYDVMGISFKYMKDPVKIKTQSQVDPKKLKQVYYDVDKNEKFSLMVHLLKKEGSRLVMVFCNTKRTVDFVADNLKLQKLDAMALHGDLSQYKRQQVLDHFHKSQKFILVCTDVAARGLDIKEVSHVYNYDLPKDAENYVHRIGRTARAGKEGEAISLVATPDYDSFGRILQVYELKIERIETPEFEKIFVKNNFRKDFRKQGFGNRARRPSNSRGRQDSRHGRRDSRSRPGGRDFRKRR